MEAKDCDIVVSKDGSRDFKSVNQALESVKIDGEKGIDIYIKNGIYKELITIDEQMKNVSFYGEDPLKTILTFDNHAKRLDEKGEELGTFRSASAFINGDAFYAENITFENSSGPGKIVGQAVAASVAGDRMFFKNCRFLGHQDTLYTDGIGRQYYKNCYIEGNVDYIFGSAVAVFDSCEIYTKDRGGYITAARTPEDYRFGYVFIDCKLTGNAPQNSVYLGRPWRDFANVAFINCWMSGIIKPEGWHNWRQPHREKTSRYKEYNSSGPGANSGARVGWARDLTYEEAKEYTLKNIFAGGSDWLPGI